MEEKIKVPRLVREMETCDLVVRKAEDGSTRLMLTASSTAPVERFFGTEVLAHTKDAVRLGRAKRGAMPLLFNHDMGDPIGMITAAAVSENRMSAEAQLFDTPRAKEVATMIAGGLRNVSVGYRVHKVEEDKKSDTYTATDWEPYEISIVTCPADPSVGVGRDAEQFEVRMIRAEQESPPAADAASRSTTAMSEKDAAAGTSAEDKARADAAAAAEAAKKTPNAIELEQQRKRAIENLCKSSKIDDRTRDFWVTSGTSVEKVSEDILTIMEDRGKSSPKSVAQLDLSRDDTERFSLVKAITACATNDWSKAGFEAECSREIASRVHKPVDPKKFFVPYDVQRRPIDPRILQSGARAFQGGDLTGAGGLYQRATTVGAAAAGGYLVETLNVGFIELLRNRAVAFRLGARELGGLVGNVNVPRQSGAASAQWIGSETTQITEADQVFGQMSLSPHTIAGYTEISRLLLLQSSPDIEGIVNMDLAAIVAIALDKGAIAGSGTAGQPLGILNTSGVGVAAGMAGVAYAGLLNFQVAVANANVVPVRGGYATTPTVAALLMQRVRFANTATPLWDGNLWDANGANGVAGFPGMSSNQIPAGDILFGDWAQLVIAEWGVLEIEVNPYANFQAGIIGVRAMLTCDIGLRYPAAFCIGTAVT